MQDCFEDKNRVKFNLLLYNEILNQVQDDNLRLSEKRLLLWWVFMF